MPCYFYSGAGNGGQCAELYDKLSLAPDLQVIKSAAQEMIQLLGQKVNYYVNMTTPLSSDTFYGEQPTAGFHGPKQMKMMIELNESALSLSNYGFNQDDEITAYLTYETFVSSFSGDGIYMALNQNMEPKSGDVFCMFEYGNDRVNGRGGNFFEITQRRDQDVGGNNLNPLGGHYGWEIKAKRMEYSWQPGLPQEAVNQQMTEDTFYGKLMSEIPMEEKSGGKFYAGSADQFSKQNIIDMNFNDTHVYGTYDLSTSDEDPVPARPKRLIDIVDNEELLGKYIEGEVKEAILEIDDSFIIKGVDQIDSGSF
jgi:hypothetical protein